MNLGASESVANVKASDLGLVAPVKSARDLWGHADVAFRDGTYSAKVPSHGVLMLRVSAAN